MRSAIIDFFSQLPMPEVDWDKREAEVAAIRAEDAARDLEERDKRRTAELVDLGAPRRAILAARERKDTPAMRKVAEWSQGEKTILVLSGRPGCGKTVAAVSWGFVSSHTPVFLRAAAFAMASRYNPEERAVWARAGALILDDLGAEYQDAKGSFAVDLDELIDTVYGDMRRMIITTNAGAEDFKQRYGARVADRIREAGEFYVCKNESLRGSK